MTILGLSGGDFDSYTSTKILTFINNQVFTTISILISVAFLTMVERKILSYTQNRVGPNKVSLIGLIQPIVDGIKLIIKENTYPVKRNQLLFVIRPILAFTIIIML